MKILTFLTFIILSSQNIRAQNIDFDKLIFEDISCYSSKLNIIEKLGEPLKIYNPDYECGFLSSDEQMKEFETLEYESIKFTGNKDDKFIIDEINFSNTSTSITYSTFQLNSETTLADLNKIFGYINTDNLKNDSGILIIPNENKLKEDGFQFILKNGKLISVMYWNPC